ncbi:hypothetical protein GCM10010112_92650 [Actinoplanes lobatus]|uniref:Tetratricopeptide (TPR) repeat protein n=1 Tax=Actinoplanes lobatus TaxID=113568 RepID=A0A7W7HL26_9ACTN|nr:hypothetical protein [Actinoplanes lobatus]MBB4752484.1 tetratricopeptide (TPR) repeat protein [Actinoplanes lobatus]GGN99130.1 hypothetical protein GCM10010112_92650 [Actinoplanes lobatus]GIE46294.1 hypothetical protein Alo02nite_91920 [Actinoplanes lobatus]
MSQDPRLQRAAELYHAATFNGDPEAVRAATGQLDSLEADLALARGRVLHAAFLRDRREDPRELVAFERAAELYAALGDDHALAEAEFWLGCFHQVVREDGDAAHPHLQRSATLARATDNRLTLSYAVRHLGFAAGMAGDHATARLLLEESVALRRELDFPAGVAAGLVALADLAYRDGRSDEAERLLDEATAVATECGAIGVLGWADNTREEHIRP